MLESKGAQYLKPLFLELKVQGVTYLLRAKSVAYLFLLHMF